MNSLIDIVDYFKNILNIPDYYVIKHNNCSLDEFCLYAIIGNINIYITTPEFSLYNLKAKIINGRVSISNGTICYDLLCPINEFNTLIINDIIKYFKGEFL